MNRETERIRELEEQVAQMRAGLCRAHNGLVLLADYLNRALEALSTAAQAVDDAHDQIVDDLEGIDGIEEAGGLLLCEGVEAEEFEVEEEEGEDFVEHALENEPAPAPASEGSENESA